MDNRTTTTSYHPDTDPALIEVLENLLNHRRETRVRLTLGDTRTGESWLSDYDTTGYIGRSTGPNPVLLLCHNRRSLGGGAILTHCILKVSETKAPYRVLYQHPNYRMPILRVYLSPVEDRNPEYPYEVRRLNTDNQGGRDVVARFKTQKEANRWGRERTR